MLPLEDNLSWMPSAVPIVRVGKRYGIDVSTTSSLMTAIRAKAAA
jgi:hypothetical protein